MVDINLVLETSNPIAVTQVSTNNVNVDIVTPGIQGPIGVTGANGKTWYYGTGVPSSGLGVDGDFYLRTSLASYPFYIKISGAWVLQANLQGPTGPTGATGATGPAGSSFADLLSYRQWDQIIHGVDEWWHSPHVNAVALRAQAIIASERAHFVPVVFPKPVSISKLAFRVTVANATANGRIALYNDHHQLPAELIAQSGSISCSTTGVKIYEFISLGDLPAGRYWLACIFKQVTAGMNVHSVAVAGLSAILGFKQDLAVDVNTHLYTADLTVAGGFPSDASGLNYDAGINTFPAVYYKLNSVTG